MTLTRATVVLLAFLLAIVQPARAESPANFSGTWELDRGHSVIPASGPMALPGQLTFVIDQRGETLKIDRRGSFMGIHRTITSTYYTDGREAPNKSPQGQTVVSKSRWDGTSLITTHTSTVNGQPETGEDVKSLSKDGKTLTIESVYRRAGQDTPERSKLILIKK